MFVIEDLIRHARNGVNGQELQANQAYGALCPKSQRETVATGFYFTYAHQNLQRVQKNLNSTLNAIKYQGNRRKLRARTISKVLSIIL